MSPRAAPFLIFHAPRRVERRHVVFLQQAVAVRVLVDVGQHEARAELAADLLLDRVRELDASSFSSDALYSASSCSG